MAGGGFLLVFIGILVFWMGLTGRLECFGQFIRCLGGEPVAA